jgi:hypothetical protein
LWLSLVVGLQVLAWMASGLFMVSQPIERVRSEHRLAEHAHADSASHGSVVAPDQIMAAIGAPVARLSLELVGERLLYAVETSTEGKVLFDARTGARVSPIDTWRVFDIMWALHIMDYREREDFNRPLLIVVTALALAMTIFGFVLLAIRLPQRFHCKKLGETSV